MRSLIGLLCIFLFTMAGSHAQPPNENISNTLLFGGEPYLAINPTNHQNIVIAWMALDASTGFRMSIKSKVSFDGGVTWGNPFVQPHLGATWHSADVSMQFRNNGTLYLTYIDYHEAPDSGGVYITHSNDGGINWSAPNEIWNAQLEEPQKLPLDRPWLAVDNSGTATDGMFYLTTKPAPWIFPPNRPYLKNSADSGESWSDFRYVDTTDYLVGNLIAVPMAFPAVSADGAFCAAYPSYVFSQSVFPKVLFAKSYSQGGSFQYYDLVVNTTPVQDTLYKLGYRLAANPANANQLAFAFVAAPNGDPDIFVTTTNNGGIAWNAPIRVNDDAIGNGKAQDMVWVSYDDAGKLVVTWRDRRNGTGTGFYDASDTYAAVSDDNANSFQPNIRLSNVTAPFNAILEQSGNDFQSVALLNDSIYAAWGDVRTGILNIYFAKTSIATGTGTPPVTINSLINLYPNPAGDKLHLSLPDMIGKKIAVSIINNNGKEVLNSNFEKVAGEIYINVSELPAGAYIVSIVLSGKLYYQQPLIIAR